LSGRKDRLKRLAAGDGLAMDPQLTIPAANRGEKDDEFRGPTDGLRGCWRGEE
jgi:hypothetical protein